MKAILLACAVLLAASGAMAQQRGGQNPAAGPRPVDRVQTIDWGAAREAEAQQAQQLRVESATGAPAPAPKMRRAPEAQLDQTHIPVMLPDWPEALANMRVYPKPDGYAASLNLPGLLIEVFGTRVTKIVPGQEEGAKVRALTVDPQGYIVQDTELGYDLSFERYGASYNISVICDNPETDDRCTTPAYIKSCADTMQIFGGEPDDGGQ